MAEPIHFDARFIRPDNPDGITRFSLGLLSELARLEKVVALVSNQRQIVALPESVSHELVNSPSSPLELFLGLRLNSLGVRVLFSPMQTTGSLGRQFKLVLTLHDLIYYRYPKPPSFLSPAIRIGWWLFHKSFTPQRLLLNRADHVVTVSETSARQIAAHRLTKKTVTVITNAAADSPLPLARARAQKTLVYMGSYLPYKNVETLVSAINLLPDYRLQLLTAINPTRQQELIKLATRPQQLEFFGGVGESQYEELLSGSQALVSASLDEGFGIPLVEAMRLGTPVICSDTEIFREVAGDAGQYFDPLDPAALAEAIRTLEHSQRWHQLSAAGLSRARDFSWSKSAKRLSTLLKSL